MKKVLSIVFAVMMLTVILSSCSAGPSNYLGVLFDVSDDYFAENIKQVMQEEVSNKENKYSAGLMVNNGKNDQSIQHDQIEVISTQPVKTLMIDLVDLNTAPEILKMTSAANKPVILFEHEPGADVIKKYEKTYYIGASDQQLGQAQGEMTAKLINNGKYDKNGDGKIQYIIVNGAEGDTGAADRADSSVKAIQAAGIKLEKAGEISTASDKAAAKEAVSGLKAEINKAELIICVDDITAVGIVDGLKTLGYNNSKDKCIPVVAIGSGNEIRELIKSGLAAGTVGQDEQELGKLMIKVAMNLATEKDPLEETNYKFDETGVAVRIGCTEYTSESINASINAIAQAQDAQ